MTNQQWEPVSFPDDDDSKLDLPITYDAVVNDEPVRTLTNTIVEPVTPIFPPSHYFATARDLIGHGWVIGREAVDKDGRGVAPESEAAEKWCIIGAKKAAIKYAPVEFKQYMLRYLESMFNAANVGIMLQHNWVWNKNDGLPSDAGQEVTYKMLDNAYKYCLKHPKSDVWPDAPFPVSKIQSSERV